MNRFLSMAKNWYLLILFVILMIFFNVIKVKNNQQVVVATQDNETVRVFSPDWGITADLISIGANVIGVSDQNGYNSWVVNPTIPSKIIDVGLRAQPNPELMASLYPDIIIDNEIYEDNRSIYNPTIPIASIEYGRDTRDLEESPQWSTYEADILKLGNYTNKEMAAKHYLTKSHQEIVQAGINIREKLGNNKTFLIVSIFDISELQVYNINHPVNLAMNIMQLELLPMGELDAWGTSSVDFHKIYNVPSNTCLVIVDPINPFVEHELKESLIWQQSQFSQASACIYRIEPIWMYGGFDPIKEFALNLEKEVIQPRPNILLNSSHKDAK